MENSGDIEGLMPLQEAIGIWGEQESSKSTKGSRKIIKVAGSASKVCKHCGAVIMAMVKAG
jgi:hypothetical protein